MELRTDYDRVRRLLRGLSLTAFLVVVSAFVIGHLGRWWWFFDLFSHFRLQYTAAFCVLVFLLLVQGMRKAAFFSLGLAAICSWGLGTYFFPRPEHDNSPALRLLCLNVYTANPQKEEVIGLIRASNADLVGLLEVDGAWIAALQELMDEEYPFTVLSPREDNFGIALLSRLRIASGNVRFLGPTTVPSIVAEVEVAGADVLLVLTHPVPPVGRDAAAGRDEQLVEIADLVRQRERGEAIVAGDFNATPWSPAMRPLKQAGLQDARRGFGISPTWMRQFPWILAIPIDHIFVTEGLRVVDFDVLPATGSDHNPLVAVLSGRRAKAPGSSE